MRPQISWSDLSGRRVGIFGLGTEGRANVRAARARGLDPVLVDDNPAEPDHTGGADRPVLATASGGLDALLGCDVVVKTPGISPYSHAVQTLRLNGVIVVGGLALWMQEADLSRVLCITGTKGKSTTTAITGHLLHRWGYRCMIGGNIGNPPQDPDAGTDYDYWVIEVSSYQAADMARTPPVAAVTSLHPDHLPWHGGGPERYFRDKLSATSQPGADLTVVNGDSELLRARRDLLGPRVQWVHADDDPAATWMEPLKMVGAHNRRNALISRACLQALKVPEADDEHALAAAASGYPGLESRLRDIGSVDGVTFIDDSLATNVLPTLAAVEAFPNRRVALLVGGQSRGIDYRPLAQGLRSRTVALRVFTLPDNGPDIHSQLNDEGFGDNVTAVDADNLNEAVHDAHRWAVPDGVVLLSPAAASFGVFSNYKERSKVFAAAMEECRESH